MSLKPCVYELKEHIGFPLADEEGSGYQLWSVAAIRVESVLIHHIEPVVFEIIWWIEENIGNYQMSQHSEFQSKADLRRNNWCTQGVLVRITDPTDDTHFRMRWL